MTALMQSVKSVLRPLKRKVEIGLPRNMRVSAPVAQLFLGGKYETRYTLVNFPSLFSPSTAYSCIYDISLFGAGGSCLGKRSIRIKPFGSFEVRPSELFGNDLPEFGLFTAKIRSARSFVFSDRHLGKITSHIYAFFYDKELSSFAVVHPQTTVAKICATDVNWRSTFLLDASSIKRVVAFQINPTDMSAESSLFMFRNGEEHTHVGERRGVILPMGTRTVSWNLAELDLTQGYFSIGARGLPTSNAKPIILTYFKNDVFSGMHA